jgi:MFS transporter, DHA2 family, methylenomycin A resistance protein
VGLLLNLGFYGQLFVVGLYLQQVRGDPPATAGLLLLGETGMATVSSAASGRLAARVGPRRPLLVGLLAGAAGLAGLATVGPAAGDPLLVGLFAVVGFGMAFAMPAATAAVVEAAPPPRVGAAAAILTTARQVGSLLGVALLGALLAGGDGFVPGMRHGLLAAAGAFLLGGALAARAVHAPTGGRRG